MKASQNVVSERNKETTGGNVSQHSSRPPPPGMESRDPYRPRPGLPPPRRDHLPPPGRMYGPPHSMAPRPSPEDVSREESFSRRSPRFDRPPIPGNHIPPHPYYGAPPPERRRPPSEPPYQDLPFHERKRPPSNPQLGGSSNPRPPPPRMAIPPSASLRPQAMYPSTRPLVPPSQSLPIRPPMEQV